MCLFFTISNRAFNYTIYSQSLNYPVFPRAPADNIPLHPAQNYHHLEVEQIKGAVLQTDF
jgi:hypothetical protein